MRWYALPCLLALWLAGAAVAEEAMPPLRYCDYPVYPPISWEDAAGEIRGVAPRAVHAVLGRLGLEVEMVVLGNWRRCLTDAAEGRVDLVIAYRSPEREAYLAFGREPLLQEEVALFYHRDRPLEVTRLDDLARYRGGLLFGESYGPRFDAFIEARGAVERVASNHQNFGKLIRGRIDYIAHERRTGELLIERMPGAEAIEVLPLTLAEDALYFAVARHSPLARRLDDLDREVASLVASGRIEAWLRQSRQAYRREAPLPEELP
ncbi:substrate-binding periplasmic protein [Bisbaumannia pacifica]|uniref:Transporter substrate-binding domain-containing protein n=1 Tax=Bisbaumannia pacifica TaxID=77098 RepID=A0ABD4L7U4_9GAMM|nr:transporter substrate-binding domain-containing protein [Halomonas pacifica]MBH8581904.1 transporter substrate-binding domain-containing protein [Halomonas pacifica]